MRTTCFCTIGRLDKAAQYADIDDESLERLRNPETMLQVSIPVRMDDGSLRIFRGYRVWHNEARAWQGRSWHPEEVRVAVQGFGNAGQAVVRLLHSKSEIRYKLREPKIAGDLVKQRPSLVLINWCAMI